MDKQICKIQNQLVTFISESFLDGGDVITKETELTKLNIIDSASMFDVVDYIFSAFGVRIPLEEINPENFETVERLSQLVYRMSNEECVL